MPERPRVFIPEMPGQYVVGTADGALHAVPDRWRGWRHRQPYRGPADALSPVPDPPALAIAVRLGVLPRSALPAGAVVLRRAPAPQVPSPDAAGEAADAAPSDRTGRPAGTGAAVQQPLVDAVQALTAAVTAQRDRLDELASRISRLEALRAADREALRQVGAIDREVQALREQLGTATDRLTLAVREIDLELGQLRERPRRRTVD